MKLGNSKIEGYYHAFFKSAANRLMTGLETESKEQGVIVVSMHPGLVKTDIAGDVADIEPSDSAEEVSEIMRNMTIADTGTFLK